jgi:hypothetical protein
MGMVIWLVLIAAFILQIIVVIKMFQNEGALKGILGLICGLYALIWGWMNSSKYGIKNIMIIWTLLLIVYIILSMMYGAAFSYSVGTPVAP